MELKVSREQLRGALAEMLADPQIRCLLIRELAAGMAPVRGGSTETPAREVSSPGPFGADCTPPGGDYSFPANLGIAGKAAIGVTPGTGSKVTVKDTAGVDTPQIQLTNTYYGSPADRLAGLFLNLPDDPVAGTNRRGYLAMGYSDYTHPYPLWDKIFKGVALACVWQDLNLAADGGKVQIWSGSTPVSPTVVVMGSNVGIGTPTPGARLDVNGEVSAPVIKETATEYSGTTDITDHSPRKVFFNVPGAGNNVLTYYKIARVKILGTYSNVHFYGWLDTGGAHVGVEKRMEVEVRVFTMAVATDSTLVYSKRGQNTEYFCAYKIEDGDGSGHDYYDLYVKQRWWDNTNGEIDIRVGCGTAAVTVWQSGSNCGTGTPDGALQSPNANYAVDTAGNVGIGTPTPGVRLDVRASDHSAYSAAADLSSPTASVAARLMNSDDAAIFAALQLGCRTTGRSIWQLANLWEGANLGDLVVAAQNGSNSSAEIMRMNPRALPAEATGTVSTSPLCTGTVTTEKGEKGVIGNGTFFQGQLQHGDLIRINGEIKTVDTVTSDTLLTVTSNFVKENDPPGVDWAKLLATVTGSGSSFTTQVAVGDRVLIGTENQQVTAVNSDTSLTTDSPFASTNSGAAMTIYPQIQGNVAIGQMNNIIFLSPLGGGQDDGAAINAAVNSLSGAGGVIMLRPGTYHIHTTIWIKRNGVKVRGYGGNRETDPASSTLLQWIVGSGTPENEAVIRLGAEDLLGSYPQGIELSDLSIDGAGGGDPNAYQAEVGVELASVMNCVLRNVHVMNMRRSTREGDPSPVTGGVGIRLTTYAIHEGALHNCDWNYFINCSAWGCAKGVVLTNKDGGPPEDRGNTNPSHNIFLGLDISFYGNRESDRGLHLQVCDGNIFYRIWMERQRQEIGLGWGVLIEHPDYTASNYFHQLIPSIGKSPGEGGSFLIRAIDDEADLAPHGHKNFVFGYAMGDKAEAPLAEKITTGPPLTVERVDPSRYLYWLDEESRSHGLAKLATVGRPSSTPLTSPFTGDDYHVDVSSETPTLVQQTQQQADTDPARFLALVEVGDRITITTSAGEETRTVEKVIDNTDLLVETPFDGSATGADMNLFPFLLRIADSSDAAKLLVSDLGDIRAAGDIHLVPKGPTDRCSYSLALQSRTAGGVLKEAVIYAAPAGDLEMEAMTGIVALLDGSGNPVFKTHSGSIVAYQGVLPSASGSVDLGSSSYRWKKLWVGDIDFSGTITGTIPPPAWGTITGTLSDQTDLQNALNGKLPLAGGTMTGSILQTGGVNLGSTTAPFTHFYGTHVHGETIQIALPLSNFGTFWQLALGGSNTLVVKDNGGNPMMYWSTASGAGLEEIWCKGTVYPEVPIGGMIYDLGFSSARWRKLWVGEIDGSGLCNCASFRISGAPVHNWDTLGQIDVHAIYIEAAEIINNSKALTDSLRASGSHAEFLNGNGSVGETVLTTAAGDHTFLTCIHLHTRVANGTAATVAVTLRYYDLASRLQNATFSCDLMDVYANWRLAWPLLVKSGTSITWELTVVGNIGTGRYDFTIAATRI